MCLALPGKIVSIESEDSLMMAKVDFSGVQKKVCLAYTPEARVGNYVVVHVGFSIAILDEQSALATLDLLAEGNPNEVCG